MAYKKLKYLILLGILVLIGFVIYDSISQPGIHDLKGDFKEVAFYRNENNTGPIERVYAVTVKGAGPEEMKKYGELMPYTKMGSTKIYFFEEGQPFPEKLFPGERNFDSRLDHHVLAYYHKDGNGQLIFNSLR